MRDLIGRGGMASVYRAWDSTLDRFVAIKIFAAGEANDDVRRRTEASLLARLNHPHLVTLHDAHLQLAESGEPGYLIMELIEGETLRARLDHGNLSAAEPAMIAADLGEALVAVHSLGVVHRDLKPTNILMAASGLPVPEFRAKLADFGIAQLLGAERLTTEGTIIGTAGYLSPEQAAGAVPGAAADIYALGLVILECLTGRQVYPGAVAEALRAQASHDPPLPDDLPAAWMSLLSQMTARDPVARPDAREVAASARENAPSLDEWMNGHSAQDDPAETTAVMMEPTRVMPAAEPAAAGTIAAVGADPAPAPAVPKIMAPARPRQRVGFAVLLSSIGAATVALVLFGILYLHPAPVHTEPTTIPSRSAVTSAPPTVPGAPIPGAPVKQPVPSAPRTPSARASGTPAAPRPMPATPAQPPVTSPPPAVSGTPVPPTPVTSTTAEP